MLLALLPAQAQRISTEQKTINVGQVLYKTPVSADFKLKNKSLKTLRIREVKTSCGCTTAAYPETVGMGKEFTITAVYDARTLGHFNKQLAIYAGREPLILTLQGEVVSEIKDFAGNYPFTLGELKTDATTANSTTSTRATDPQSAYTSSTTPTKQPSPSSCTSPTTSQPKFPPRA